MKGVLILILTILPIIAFSQKKKQRLADQDTENWRYELEAVNVGIQGTCLVKVWSFSKNPTIATNQARKNAVHGVIFKGVPAKERIPGKKPLVQNAEIEKQNADFFKSFFQTNGGDYMRFVTLTNNGAIAAGDIMKIGKKEYKVGVVVTVQYNDLRKYLEEKGIVKRLDAGF